MPLTEGAQPGIWWKAVLPASRREEVERYRDLGMLRGPLVLEETEGGTFTVRCTDQRDAVWLQLYVA
jgi:hypothetical protein